MPVTERARADPSDDPELRAHGRSAAADGVRQPERGVELVPGSEPGRNRRERQRRSGQPEQQRTGFVTEAEKRAGHRVAERGRWELEDEAECERGTAEAEVPRLGERFAQFEEDEAGRLEERERRSDRT